jgi:hypothetical protein
MSIALTTLTIVHVLISLVGIGSGAVVAYGLLTGKRLDRWTAVFLTTTIATSATGFLFPVDRFLPSHAIGILSLVVLGVAVFARYSKHLEGRWNPAYIVTALTAQYLNVFVLVVQSFLKVPALKALAPTQTEPPFAIVQGIVLLGFIALTVAATLKARSNHRFAMA